MTMRPSCVAGLAALALLLPVVPGAADTHTPAAGAAAGETRQQAPARRLDPALVALQQKIIAGQANLAEVRRALAFPEIGALANTVHGLYSMRWHRAVYNLLHDMWDGKRDRYPELQWDQFDKAPVRLALASTLLRIEPGDSEPYVTYLRNHRRDRHEFHRAQVLIGLAFNADPRDVDYLAEMAASDESYVAQTAITALGLMSLPPAERALEDLHERFRDDPRAELIGDVLRQAYNNTGNPRDERLWQELKDGAPSSGEVTGKGQ